MIGRTDLLQQVSRGSEFLDDLDLNPLLAQGYPSIGCRPCTDRVEGGADPRSGRWAGSDKTECGLHL